MLKLLLVLMFTVVTSVAHSAFPNKRLILTDFLDDDARALAHMFMSPAESSNILAIVVTSGNVQLRAAALRRLVRGFNLNIPVYAGTSSNLASNPVTEFAGHNDLEGLAYLGQRQQFSLNGLNLVDGDGALQIAKLIQAARSSNFKIDVLCMTAPTDLVKALEIVGASTARMAFEDFFAMGLYKITSHGLALPYNAQVDLVSLRQFLLLQKKRIFKRVFHIPSDTVQQRSGLDGGYIPTTPFGQKYRADLRELMNKTDVGQRLFWEAIAYGSAWIRTAIQQFGMGFLKDSNGWVISSFKNPKEAAGFYFADIITAHLSSMDEKELLSQRFDIRKIDFAHTDKSPLSLAITNEVNSVHFIDLHNIDGTQILNSHLSRWSSFSNNNPSPKIKISVSSGGLLKDENLDQPIDLKPKALIVVFKNSPDDWIALLHLLSTQRGRDALARGGVICEGFDTKKMCKSVQSVFENLGIQNIPVSAGYQYHTSEVNNISNFKGELALNELGEASRAFEQLKKVNAPLIRTNSLIDRATNWAKHNNGEIDLLIFGEGLDVYHAFDSSPAFLGLIGHTYVMGGGRRASEGVELTRNWIVHTDLIFNGMRKLTALNKPVEIFSTHQFGGSFVAYVDENPAPGQALFNLLNKASSKSAAVSAIRTHWEAWARVFSYINTPTEKRSPIFDREAPVATLTTSPLATAIAEAWVTGSQENLTSGYERKPVSLLPESLSIDSSGRKIFIPKEDNSSSAYWLRANNDNLDVASLAQSVGLSIAEYMASDRALNIHSAVKEHGPFSAEAIEAIEPAKTSINANNPSTCQRQLD